MIQSLASRYPKQIAYSFFLIFSFQLNPAFGRYNKVVDYSNPSYSTSSNTPIVGTTLSSHIAQPPRQNKTKLTAAVNSTQAIGGPNQPEMASFKSASVDNMVNLFTGDFNYNIPLMDVGGYPINLFYDGGVTMEQEASWVGLGWNINPGSITRNMRGIPDDFNGEDTLVQRQEMKPNKTWGASIGADLETLGLKGSGNISLGVSVNNYLGPSLDLSYKNNISFNVLGKAGSEKSISANLGSGISLSSRNGLTLSRNVSLTSNSFAILKGLTAGIGITADYNSRSGLKQLQINEQMSYNVHSANAAFNTYANHINTVSLNTPITFAKPSYIPSLRMPVTNSAFSGHFQLGSGIFGIYGSVAVEVYKQTSEVAPGDSTQRKPLVGYLYYEKARNNPAAIMDFTRINDNEVTANTPIISAPQYTYDVFSIQGEGTGGSIRAYRNDISYIRDNTTQSRDKSSSAGADIGGGHFGANFNSIKTPSSISEWKNGNKLRDTLYFDSSRELRENVYFRNPGETSVLDPVEFARVGGQDLVRFKLGGNNTNPTIEPMLERFSRTSQYLGTTDSLLTGIPAERKKRTQVINFLTAADASKIGLDTAIKSYDKDSILNYANNLKYTLLPRVDDKHKKHHLSQVNVTEANGKRYIYGLPVYNIVQKDFSFSVKNKGDGADQVATSASEATTLNTESGKDGFLQISTTPAYAHSFLLTGLLSSDYVDVTGDGITEDDLGQAVKFNYTKYANHRWQTPRSMNNTLLANFNAGNKSENKDDKGLITYGERESWYLHSIESKTMIAIFTTDDRKDGKGVLSELSTTNYNDNSQKRLRKIDLFSKADLKKNGVAKAKPVKTVWFAYSYTLCAGAPGNNASAEMLGTTDVNAAKGKLTLDSIYFTYNGKARANKTKYAFGYTTSGAGNPAYLAAASDRWGSYKPYSANPGRIKNADFPYAVQNRDSANANAGAWLLKKILLPAGGQIEVNYESDDYAYVQNRRSVDMMQLAGLGRDSTKITNKLFIAFGLGASENDYVFINVPEACTDKSEVFRKYLDGMPQLAFKLAVNMPKGIESIRAYATYSDWGVYDPNTIWVKLNVVDDLTPLSLASLDYLRERLPGQAFPGYDVSESSGLEQVGEMLLGMLDGLKSAFQDPILYLRSQGKAQTIDAAASFVRLNDPDGVKYGGGYRVKSVKLKDNWQAMTGQYTSEYGQEYDYTTTENFNGASRRISSGVASYEPSIGGEENPFQSIIQVENKVPLGPASIGAIEMPVLDAFFPAPVVGYSKVSVRSLQRGNIPAGYKSRSGIGRQVTEFYTAKDFPVYYNNTSFDPASDKQDHQASLLAFFYKYAYDSRALSQGFIVETNDMHGKLKSQSSYAENDSTTRINYTENFYRNTCRNGLAEQFDFVDGAKGGMIKSGNMGIDIELMTDTREFSIKSNSFELQAQVDFFPVLLPFWIPFIWPTASNSENTYRAVTTTKVINYHAVLDSMVVIDKGSSVSTKNLLYDAETGNVVVTRTNNEFDAPVYNVSYPAYWAYSGMGLAYKNIDAVYSNVNFYDGKIVSGNVPAEALESGDELYLIEKGVDPADHCGSLISSANDIAMLWAFNNHKNMGSFTDPNPDLVFIDKKGKPFTKNSVSFRIVRSGKRNMLDQGIQSILLHANPIQVDLRRQRRLVTDANVVHAGAVEYKEKWQVDNDVFNHYKLVPVAPSVNLISNGDFSAGNTDISSDYYYQPNWYQYGYEGSYAVGSYPPGNNPGFWGCSDHTGGGNMMILNGAANPGIKFWKQNINVLPNTDYIFSFWAASLNDKSPAYIQVLINNVEVGALQVSSNGCEWRNFIMNWNSGTNTTMSLALVDVNTWGDGNDFAIDDLSFKLDDCKGQMMEVADCNGYLERSVNPYLKGLIGVFRPQKQLTFYGERAETDPSASTNLRSNGFLKSFTPYWNPTADGRFIPDRSNTKWTWVSESTRANTKGMETETKNALNVYTSAQYGYGKSVPVAIANNAQQSEIFAEGFEDYSYADFNANLVCGKKHVDFSNLSGAQVLNTASLPFAAHSGSYVLALNGLRPLSKTFNVRKSNDSLNVALSPSSVNNSPWYFGPAGAKFYRYTYASFPNVCDSAIGNSATNTWMSDGANNYNGQNPAAFDAYQQTNCQGNSFADSVVWVMRFFYKAPTSGVYNIKSAIRQYSGSYDLYIRSEDQPGVPNYSYRLFDSDPSFNYDYSYSYSSNGYMLNCDMYATQLEHTNTVSLCGGKIYEFIIKYKMNPYMYSWTFGSTNGTGDASWCNGTWFQPWMKFLGCGITGGLSGPVYSSKYQAADICTITQPVAPNDSMMNPTFTIPPDKPMLFSAWVRNSCSGCSNKVTLQFDGVNNQSFSFSPSGPVIEGWQKIEGVFKAPPLATQMTMRFDKSGFQTSYLDDIRIHPYNANMKSYIYDPISLRLVAELDANNYATFYDYDEEGTLIRTKVETKEGIKTINETRSFQQRALRQIQ